MTAPMWLLAWTPAALGGPDAVVRTVDLGTRGVRGLTWHDGALWALDPNQGSVVRAPSGAYPLPADTRAPRGLDVHDGAAWFLDWREAEGTSRLGRLDLASGETTWAPLGTLVGASEPLALAWDGADLWLSYDARGRTERGLVHVPGGDLLGAGVRHLPCAGLTRGLAFGDLEGARYLFTTTGDLVAVNDPKAGRPIFAVPAPTGAVEPWGAAVGDGLLWVGNRERGRGGWADALDLATLDAPWHGPWRLREVTLTVTSEPGRDPDGWVEHVYGGIAPLENQAPVPGHRDVEASPGAREHDATWFAADDPTFPQDETVLRWEAPRRRLESRAVLGARLRETRNGVYPHRVEPVAPPGAWAADSWVFGLDDDRVWRGFVDRVVRYVADRYTLPADDVRAELGHPYWAARDVTDYVFATYLYPTKAHPATTDLPRGLFHNSPANLRAALSEGRWSGDEITDCAGGNTLLGGALRFLGHRTRILSSVFEGPGGAELLEPGAPEAGVKAHHFSEVWLGPRYGWQVVDGTPEVKANALERPAAPGQGVLVRSVVAPRRATRVVLTVASGEHPSMIRYFPPPAPPPGDQGYGFRGRYEEPTAWVYPKHEVAFGNPLGLEVAAERVEEGLRVRWTPRGPWELLPDATLRVTLERWRGGSRVGERRVLATSMPVATGLVVADDVPDPEPGTHLRALVTLEGDPRTGARSAPLASLPGSAR